MNISQASGRQVIDVAEATEIARMARGNDPNTISTGDMQSLLGSSALVLDGQRSRPRYFDGRFLTGADLTGDQDYIRQRQDDLASAVGTGVVAGLQVSLGGSVGGQTLVIEAGHGVTPTGELVMVTSRRAVPILDLAAGARLDATLGLSVQPRAQLGKRTGLFLLVLRPVQFTANPIAAYPTAINGPRTVEDSDIIEATAIDLIPYPNTGGAGSLDEARRAVARDLFLGQPRGLPQDALPLAMVALAKGVPSWIDVAMVRRETGADTPLQVSMGGRPRALAEAFVVQHRAHLADVLASRAQAGLTQAFAAAQYFAALPAAGQMPAAAILPDDLGFQQMYFPDAVDVDLSFVPSDEVAALVEESLALPPIDLLAAPADLDATGVIVLAPVTRQRLQAFEASLAQLDTTARPDPGQGVRQGPANLLAQLAARRAVATAQPVADPTATAKTQNDTAAWQLAWAEAVQAIPLDATGVPLVWFVRRRAVAYESRMIGLAVEASGDDEALKTNVDQHLKTLALKDELTTIAGRSTPLAVARTYAFLGGPVLMNSTILTAAAMHDLQAALPPVTSGTGVVAPTIASGLVLRSGLSRLAATRAKAATNPPTVPKQTLLRESDVIDVASDYGDPNIGDGLTALLGALPAAIPQAGQLWLGGTGQALDLDHVADRLSADALTKFAQAVSDLAGKANDDAAKALAQLIAQAAG
jgi:hypothetical protein